MSENVGEGLAPFRWNDAIMTFEGQEETMMRKVQTSWLPLGVAFLMVAVLGVMGCAAPQEPAEETTAAAEEPAAEEEVEFLYVQHADGVTLQEGVLTLEGIGDTVLYFSDRPHRVVGRETLEEFLADWAEGEGSFAEVPPNAVLTAKQVDELRDLVVVLKDPVLTDGTLVYQVEVLDGPDAGSADFAALFIDVISVGHPAVGPTSPRGAARRTARRTTRRMLRREEAYEDAYGDDEQYYDDSSELEERLRELDDLLAQGLITEEDYEREKDELLRQY